MKQKHITRLMSVNTHQGIVRISFSRAEGNNENRRRYQILLSNLSVHSQQRLDRLTYLAEKTTIMFLHNYIFSTSVFKDRVLPK